MSKFSLQIRLSLDSNSLKLCSIVFSTQWGSQSDEIYIFRLYNLSSWFKLWLLLPLSWIVLNLIAPPPRSQYLMQRSWHSLAIEWSRSSMGGSMLGKIFNPRPRNSLKSGGRVAFLHKLCVYIFLSLVAHSLKFSSDQLFLLHYHMLIAQDLQRIHNTFKFASGAIIFSYQK